MDVFSSTDRGPRPLRSSFRRGYWPLLAAASGNRPYLQLVKQVLHLEGDLVECGLFRGQRLLRIATLVNLVTPEKTVYGLGNLESRLPTGRASNAWRLGQNAFRLLPRFQATRGSCQRIVGLASDLHAKLKLCNGYYEETLPQVNAKPFCFVHLDCDVYDSYLTCLESLYDQVVPGGIILVDDYRSSDWPGATRAVDEFFANRAESIERCDDPDRPAESKYFVVKQRPEVISKAA